jgi:hypothetical protein
MCNLFGHTRALSALQRRFNAVSRPLNWAADAKPSNFEPRSEIRIRDTAAGFLSRLGTNGAVSHFQAEPDVGRPCRLTSVVSIA